LTVEVKEGEGTILVNGKAQTASCGYSTGTTLQIEAQPASGYLFDKWGGGLSGSTNPTSIKLDSSKKVYAYFINEAELKAQDPRADAGSNRDYPEGASVTLDGSDSSDPLDRSLNYNWEQTDGSPAVSLSGANSKTASFTAPDITGEKSCLTFRLTVTDAEGDKNSDEVRICINSTNIAPHAVIDQAAQYVDGGNTVSLNGSGSYDEDGSIASYSWVVWGGNTDITSALNPILAAETGATATFTAPNIDGYVEIQMTVTDDEGATASEIMTISITSVEGPVYTSKLYFPHIASNDRWETEICLINKTGQSITGMIEVYSSNGNRISQMGSTVNGYGRRSIVIGNEFSAPEDIGYAIFLSNSSNLCGYTKFYREGLYRVAVPAIDEISSGEEIYVPHIASNKKWWTGLALVNTANSEKKLTITFSNGEKKTIGMAAGEHKNFAVKELFGDIAQPDIESAVITGGTGVIGLELFNGGKQLSGLLLKDTSAKTLYFPHVASNEKWWTGIVAYNPTGSDANLIVTPYTKSGETLGPLSVMLKAGEKYIGVISDLDGFPETSAWFKIESSQNLNGLELFGTNNGNSLAGYSTVDIKRQNGIFPKLDQEGWTGIAFVNTTGTTANVDLRIYDDSGEKLYQDDIILDGYAKSLGQPADIFGGSITAGTYMKFSSDKAVVGFQLNGSDDGMMLDALPGM